MTKMKNMNEFSVVCTEMGAHEARVLYTGAMCQAGALALVDRVDSLFAYYRYNRIVLSIESPGGAVDGMEYVLRAMDTWAKEGRLVAVESTFQCASAAAFILAMGAWGHRRVDRGTYLLFHSARIDGSSMAGLTAAASRSLLQTLNGVDQKMLDVMINKMLLESGGAANLVELVLARVRYVDLHWKDLAADLTTLSTGIDGNRKPDWLKALQKWTRHGADPRKFVLEMRKHLNLRLQRDVRMDLCEAYVLCLIDEIDGVLDAGSVKSAKVTDVIKQKVLPDERADWVEVGSSSWPVDTDKDSGPSTRTPFAQCSRTGHGAGLAVTGELDAARNLRERQMGV
jgi:ATP-dependent protease ClpP protease subunit